MTPDLFTWAREQATARDAAIADHDASRKAEAIRVATYVAKRIALTHGGVTSTEVLRALDERHPEVIEGMDRRFLGAVLIPSKGWVRTGETRPVGSKARHVPVWRWGGA